MDDSRAPLGAPTQNVVTPAPFPDASGPELARRGHLSTGQEQHSSHGKLLVYGDFSSPNGCLASHRIDALKAVDVDIEWRAVELHPHLSVMGAPLTGPSSTAADQAMSSVNERLLPGEVLVWKKPTMTPHTQGSVAAFAEAVGAGVSDDVRQLLMTAYWTRGANIGDPEVLRRLIAGAIRRGHSTSDPLRRFGYAVSLSRGPITTSAYRRIRDWRTQWNELETHEDLAVVDEQGASTGLDALDRLAALITEAGAPPNPVLPNPGRFPEVTLHPPLGWATTVGRSWDT
ncbi:MAG: hypothetical protein M3Y71_07445 [Actinomycetota bacterium]|nr:hypothetical protein [Actinomycetota bacterium]